MAQENPYAKYKAQSQPVPVSQIKPIIAAPVDPNKQAQEVRAQSAEARAQADQAMQMEKFQRETDPAAIAAKAAAEAVGKAQGEAQGGKVKQSEGAKNLLLAAGVDPTSGFDRVADLIRGSTSGTLESAGASVYGGVSGKATPGMENISRLRTIVSDMTLQLTGGSLGTGVSNADVTFLKERVGNLADPSVPANERLAAWQEVKARLAKLGGIEIAPEAPRGVAGEGERFMSDEDKALQAELQGAFDRGATGAELNAISAKYGRPALQGLGEAIKARDSGVKGIKATVDPTGVGQDQAGAGTAYATGAANALTAGMLDELGSVMGLDPTQIEAGKRYLAEKEGLAYGLGEITGGAMAMLPVARGAQIAGLGARAPLAADVAYGGAFGAGEQNDNRLAGALVGGTISGGTGALARRVMGAMSGQAAPDDLSRVSQAENAGIRTMTSDIAPPETFMGRTAQQIGERIPLVGTGPVRAAQQQERVTAVQELLGDYGAGAEGVIDKVARSLGRARSAELTKFTTMKNEVTASLAGAGEVPVPNATRAIDDAIAKLRGIDEASYRPVIERLQSQRDNIAGGKTIDQLEGVRKILGEMFDDPNLASIRGDGQKAVNSIYGPLAEDIKTFIKERGGQAAANKWGVANKRLSEMAGELNSNTLKSVLRQADVTPETVERMLFSTKPSEVRALYRNLPDDGKAAARSAIVDRMFRDMKVPIEDVSPDQFVNRVRDRANSIGVFFTGEEAQRLNGLVRALKLTSRAGKAGVVTDTGQQAVPFGLFSALTGGAGLALGGAATGGTVAATSVAGGLGLGAMARIIESAPVRNAVMRMRNSKVGSPEEAKAAQAVRAAITTALNTQYQSSAKPDMERPAPSFEVPR